MRYRCPKDCASVVHAGAMLTNAGDGTVEADEAAASALAPHGLVPIGDAPPRLQPGAVRPRADDRRMLR